jgi:hypothetical protein
MANNCDTSREEPLETDFNSYAGDEHTEGICSVGQEETVDVLPNLFPPQLVLGEQMFKFIEIALNQQEKQLTDFDKVEFQVRLRK